MNVDLLLMLGSLLLLAISGLLVFCFTEAKGKNTPHARRERTVNMRENLDKPVNEQISLGKELI